MAEQSEPRNVASGLFSVIRTVAGSMTSTDLTGSIRYDAWLTRFFSRSKLNLTSSALSGLPELNFTSGLSLKVKVVRSSDTCQDSASIGTICFVSSAGVVTRVS